MLENTRDILTRVFIFVISLHVAGNIFGFLAGAATGIAGERVVSRLRRRLYDHLLTQEMGFFDRHKSGDLVSRLGADTLLVQQATTQSLNEVSIGLIKVLSGVILMFIVSWELTFIVFASLLGWLCLVMNPLMRVVQRLTTRYQEALAKAAIASTEVHRPDPRSPDRQTIGDASATHAFGPRTAIGARRDAHGALLRGGGPGAPTVPGQRGRSPQGRLVARAWRDDLPHWRAQGDRQECRHSEHRVRGDRQQRAGTPGGP